jgi:UDP:flavonoid glycosyltransferase YjiC (YdhE family)
VPIATLIPHLHPSSAPGAPPYALGARIPRTRVGRRLWLAAQHPVEAGLRKGRSELNETRARLGLPPVARLYGGLSDRLCIVAAFPQLEYPRRWPESVHIVGPLIWEPPAPTVALPPGEDPLVMVAPSTAQDPTHVLLRASVRGLAREPVRVIAATGHRPFPRPLRMPPNARLVEWISYGRTMPACSLVISHVGHGTLALALSSGCPLLAVPHSGDMGENAARLEWAGLGVRLPWRFVSPTTVRLAVRRALADASLATRAHELSVWAAQHDGAARAAELVEQLAGAAV